MIKISKIFSGLKSDSIRRSIFRREVEAFYYSDRKIALPAFNKITSENLQDFRKNYPFRFFSSSAELQSLKNKISEIESLDEIIKTAEKILSNKYNIFNRGEIDFGNEINWQKDYNSGFEWPQTLSWKANYFDSPKGTDIKFCWELARFHQGISLGKAYIITGDERYTECFYNLITDFNRKNKFCTGVNWVDAAEVSVRLINILFTLSFFLDSELTTGERLNEIFEIILSHSIFIENNDERSGSFDSSNLINITALTFVGLTFSNSLYGKKNLKLAQAELEVLSSKLIWNDGTCKEQSIHFHIISLEAFCLCKIFLEKTSFRFSELFNHRLERMFEALFYYIRDDRSIPKIGDDISSVILDFSYGRKSDYCSLLSLGAGLFNNNKFKRFKNSSLYELLFFLGEKKLNDYLALPENYFHAKSIGFPEGGHYLLNNDGVNLFIKAGEIGNGGKGAPGHNDTFSFELQYENRLFIADPGTYSFYADKDLRNYFRSEKSHNTFYLDDVPLVEFDGLFKVKQDFTKPKVIEWNINENENVFVGLHYAYARLSDPVVCKRMFHYLKNQKLLIIKDEFIGGANHLVNSSFHLHPEVKVEQNGLAEFELSSGHLKIKMTCSSSTENFQARIVDAEYSESYGKIQPTKKIFLSLNDKLPQTIYVEFALK